MKTQRYCRSFLQKLITKRACHACCYCLPPYLHHLTRHLSRAVLIERRESQGKEARKQEEILERAWHYGEGLEWEVKFGDGLGKSGGKASGEGQELEKKQRMRLGGREGSEVGNGS